MTKPSFISRCVRVEKGWRLPVRTVKQSNQSPTLVRKEKLLTGNFQVIHSRFSNTENECSYVAPPQPRVTWRAGSCVRRAGGPGAKSFLFCYSHIKIKAARHGFKRLWWLKNETASFDTACSAESKTDSVQSKSSSDNPLWKTRMKLQRQFQFSVLLWAPVASNTHLPLIVPQHLFTSRPFKSPPLLCPSALHCFIGLHRIHWWDEALFQFKPQHATIYVML